MTTPSDFGQQLFDTINSMNRVRMMELGLTQAPKAPRMRQLDVRDDHVVYLLTLVADDIKRDVLLGKSADIVALEMQAALNSMVRS